MLKKTPTSKTAKKPAKKQTATKRKTKKATPKPRVAKKKVVKKVKKPEPRVKITAEDRAPKRPLSSYFRFHKKYMVGLDRFDGETSQQYITRGAREAGASWTALSEAEKKPFRDEHAAEFEEYKKKKEEYDNTVNPDVIKEINRQRKIKGKKMIRVKNPHFVATPYFIFLAEERAKIPPLTTLAENMAFVKEGGRKWSAMSDEEKQHYKNLRDEKVKAMSASE